VCLALRGISEKGFSFYAVFLFIFGRRRGGVSQSLPTDRIYPRLCQAPWPVMNTNDPGTEDCFFHSSFFLCITSNNHFTTASRPRPDHQDNPCLSDHPCAPPSRAGIWKRYDKVLGCEGKWSEKKWCCTNLFFSDYSLLHASTQRTPKNRNNEKFSGCGKHLREATRQEDFEVTLFSYLIVNSLKSLFLPPFYCGCVFNNFI